MRRFTSTRIALMAAAGLALAAAAPAMAQNQPVAMPQSIAPLGEGVTVLGAAPSSAKVSFQVAMKLRDYKGLVASNNAGKVLTWAEMERDHLPRQADYDKVLNWALNSGLTVEHTYGHRMMVQLSGNAATVSRALGGVHFSRIESEGKQFVSADSAPALPAFLVKSVLSVNGLQPHLHAYKTSIETDLVHKDDDTTPPFYAGAFVTAYNAKGVGKGGKGVTTAILIDVFPLASDLDAYYKRVGSTQKSKNVTFINLTGATMGPPSGEESMDVEVASAIAPAAKMRVYAPGDLRFDHLDLGFAQMIQDVQKGQPITQMSMSLGACETKIGSRQIATDDQYMATLSGLGVSVFASSGDKGSRECGGKKPGVSFFATSPNATAAGGTSLTLKPNGTTKFEGAWNGSGGGVSAIFPVPAYQASLGFKGRAIPDISADANPSSGALVIYNGKDHQIGGTSLSSPILAGLTALANADRLNNNKAPIGLLNAHLYAVDASNFRDITSGSNTDYQAGPGYDLVTGLGAPLMKQLVPVLTALP